MQGCRGQVVPSPLPSARRCAAGRVFFPWVAYCGLATTIIPQAEVEVSSPRGASTRSQRGPSATSVGTHAIFLLWTSLYYACIHPSPAVPVLFLSTTNIPRRTNQRTARRPARQPTTSLALLPRRRPPSASAPPPQSLSWSMCAAVQQVWTLNRIAARLGSARWTPANLAVLPWSLPDTMKLLHYLVLVRHGRELFGLFPRPPFRTRHHVGESTHPVGSEPNLRFAISLCASLRVYGPSPFSLCDQCMCYSRSCCVPPLGTACFSKCNPSLPPSHRSEAPPSTLWLRNRQVMCSLAVHQSPLQILPLISDSSTWTWFEPPAPEITSFIPPNIARWRQPSSVSVLKAVRCVQAHCMAPFDDPVLIPYMPCQPF